MENKCKNCGQEEHGYRLSCTKFEPEEIIGFKMVYKKRDEKFAENLIGDLEK